MVVGSIEGKWWRGNKGEKRGGRGKMGEREREKAREGTRKETEV